MSRPGGGGASRLEITSTVTRVLESSTNRAEGSEGRRRVGGEKASLKAGVEPELWERIKSGDPEAQRVFFDRYFEVVRGYLQRRHVSAQGSPDSDEIAVEAFTRAFRSVGTFEGRSTVQTWLISIARRAAIDFYRGRRRHQSGHASLDHGDGAHQKYSFLSDGESPSGAADRLIREESKDRLRRHLGGLDEDYREVIVLRILTGMSTKETAEVMDRSTAAVKMLLLRAMRRLEERLKEDSYFAK